jgi:hypothetical protein
MKYDMTKPCAECPFLKKHTRAFTLKRLREFASGEFPCHKTAESQEDDDGRDSGYVATPNSHHCAGALIFLEKRQQSHQMMRICERLGLYNHERLDMTAEVR